MQELQWSPDRLSVKVQDRNYLWMPATSNLGQLYTIPKEVNRITWEPQCYQDRFKDGTMQEELRRKTLTSLWDRIPYPAHSSNLP